MFRARDSGAERFNTPEFAYLFLRPIHVLAVCMGPILAVFVMRYVGRRLLAISVIALAAVYLQVLVFQVPHVRTLRDGDPALVDRVASLAGPAGDPGALVLVENTRIETWMRTQPPGAGGGRVQGLRDPEGPLEEATAELRKWGIRHLLVWSKASLAYLNDHPDLFTERWMSGPWHQFEFLAADAREVATTVGTGHLASFNPLGARIALESVQAGAAVIVRTNFHPSWSATVEESGAPVVLERVNGQLGFRAPRNGSYVVTLEYPRRLG